MLKQLPNTIAGKLFLYSVKYDTAWYKRVESLINHMGNGYLQNTPHSDWWKKCLVLWKINQQKCCCLWKKSIGNPSAGSFNLMDYQGQLYGGISSNRKVVSKEWTLSIRQQNSIYNSVVECQLKIGLFIILVEERI